MSRRPMTAKPDMPSSGKTTVWILGDQLNPKISALAGIAPSECVVLLVESIARARKLPYHQQKLVLLWSAMRHFAEELRTLGYTVDYYQAQPDFEGALRTHLKTFHPSKVRFMDTAEYGVARQLGETVRAFGVQVEVTPNNMFLSSRNEFSRQAHLRKVLILESFYRQIRRQTGLLLDGDQPVGGKWNYDHLNRKRPPVTHEFPSIPLFLPDQTTRDVIEVVRRECRGHFGSADDFYWPVTRRHAERFFDDFLDNRLDMFGPYEDAIVTGERALYHSLLSPLCNIGLLEPLEMCRQVERRYWDGLARLNSVEGFIRQVIGWREFVYEIYHWRMPEYIRSNYFQAELPLPAFYWTGETHMFCVADAIKAVRRYGINHHIQRLMVTGNFALIAGVEPQAVNEWYHLAYIDAYEWVVAPNVLGLALYADGGLVATKPYAASAHYINKMSDCCVRCAYDHRQVAGEKACPFNALYWDFLARHAEKFRQNPRMNLVMASLDKRDRAEMADLRLQAQRTREKILRQELF